MISSFVGIIGPGGMASIFALSVDHQILSGNLVWLVLVAIAAIGTGAAFLM